MESKRLWKMSAILSAVFFAVTVTAANAYDDIVVTENAGQASVRIIVPPIFFGPDRGGFGDIARETMESNHRVLRRIAEILNRFEDHSILIEGHANPTTPPGTALRAEEETGSPRILGLQPLSEERAATILEYLVGLGVERSRLSAVGLGGTRVIAEYGNRGNWWQNRRVEFTLQKMEPQQPDPALEPEQEETEAVEEESIYMAYAENCTEEYEQ
ncbi:MAG: OmpA family protein [Treponema sp.]|nr:OmpA family protein [Treponema sp.]